MLPGNFLWQVFNPFVIISLIKASDFSIIHKTNSCKNSGSIAIIFLITFDFITSISSADKVKLEWLLHSYVLISLFLLLVPTIFN